MSSFFYRFNAVYHSIFANNLQIGVDTMAYKTIQRSVLNDILKANPHTYFTVKELE